jgi:glutamine cyclotransferase
MTRRPLRKVSHTVTGFYTKAPASMADHHFARVRLDTGEVVQRVDLAQEFFGEGITVVKNEVLQLTWQSHTGFVSNVSDFRLLRRFSYSGEGWGLTTNGREIFMSDGTPEIRVLDTGTFGRKATIYSPRWGYSH